MNFLTADKVSYLFNWKWLTASVATFSALASSLPCHALPLSPGDRIRLSVSEPHLEQAQAIDDPFRFTGLYEVNLDGKLQLPLIAPITVSSLELDDVEQMVRSELIQAGLFQPSFVQVSAEIAEWAPVPVLVSGAVFLPGRVLTDGRQAANLPRFANQPPVDRETQPFTLSGDYPTERFLTSAIRQVGGVKPDADLENVRLIRNGYETVIDMSGIVTAQPVTDIPLIAGDHIIVPEIGYIQPELVRPTAITPDVIAVFLSNQTQPRGGGATGGDIAEFTYGTRFSQAAVAATCGGGSSSVNANRRVALVQTDLDTGNTAVYDRSIEDLLRDPNGSENGNPYLMPNDSIVCYDASVANTANIFNVISTILNPFTTILDIFRD
ncbi:MAG: periplasmic polysaccharide export protein [Leptolyngbya sp.]|nr:MAG: periplasmic polysaccharide export protein [Leptolyngbya sp.]